VADFLQFTVSGLAAGSLYAIVALGLVLLYRGTRVLNFAHGAFGALGAYVFWNLYPAHVPLLVAFVVGVAAGAVAGVATERLVARPLASASILIVVVATLAVDEIIRFFLVQTWGANPRTVPPLATRPTLIFGSIVIPAQRLLIFGVSLALSLLLAVFLRRTLIGVAIRASAEDLTAVRLHGFSGSAMTMFVWGASAALSAVAGILVSPLLGLTPAFMTLVLIRAFAGALVGGLTSLGGAMAGGLLIGVLESHIQSLTSYHGAVEAALFGVVLAVLLLRPEGLFGTKETEPPSAFQRQRRFVLRLPIPAGVRRRARLLPVLIGGLALAAVWSSGNYYAFVGGVAVTYATVGVSMYLLSGLAGQLSLGHGALMGVGGFGAGLLATRADVPYPLALLVAGGAAAVAAMAIGLPSFRIRGLYLAVTTLVFGIAAERFLFRLNLVSGYARGLELPAMSVHSGLAWSVVVLGVAVAAAVRVSGSKPGRAMEVLHHDEILAQSWGIAVSRYKLLAFGLSGFLAGLAGVTYATLLGHVTSEAFSAELAITLVAMAIVGGLGSLTGVIAGSLLFAVLPELLRGALQWLPLAYSGTFLLVILFLPGGLAQLWEPTL